MFLVGSVLSAGIMLGIQNDDKSLCPKGDLDDDGVAFSSWNKLICSSSWIILLGVGAGVVSCVGPYPLFKCNREQKERQIEVVDGGVEQPLVVARAQAPA